MRRWIYRLTIGAALLLVITVLALDQWVRRTELPELHLQTSPTVVDVDGVLLRAYSINEGTWRLPVTLAQVDPGYLAQLIAFEDKRFQSHFGVDPQAMTRAVFQAVINGRVISGGSTLTMQVARLLEGGETGQMGAKIRQIRVALALERRLTKDQILTLYLNLAPMGGNIEGVRAASLTYFGKEPGRLTPAQAALLVALPQAPTSRRPDRHPLAAHIARDRVLARSVGAGVIPLDEAEAAYAETTPNSRIPFPFLAPHLADFLLAQSPGISTIHTSIERDVQAGLETLLRERVQDLDQHLSAALIVVDHQTGALVASVGSASYFDTPSRGFIDMTTAVRSPGSTLKPLIYGLAFEAGIAHPQTLIVDRPMSFGGYIPQNFDNRSRGVLSISEALQLSLNVPAVAVLDRVGPAQLLARIRRTGVEPQLPTGGTPGLAIALGGVGLSLHDLVTVYTAIARGGTPITLSAQPVAPIPANPVLLPGAAWQVADILAATPPPVSAAFDQIAYKTGTSYGYRDAWAIGFDGQHVIGVWVGRPDGASVPGITGITTAAPLLFEAFSRLKSQPVALPAPPPAVLTVSNAELPIPLRNFAPRGNIDFIDLTHPQIIFPPDGAQVELGLANIDSPVELVIKIRNGTPPFNWIINDQHQGPPIYDRQHVWPTIGGGFVTIQVIDSLGRAANASVFLQ